MNIHNQFIPAANLEEAQWDVCLADPPWQNQSGERHYPTMPLDRIMGMGEAIRAIMKPDSWLFLWTTKSLQDEARDVMNAWGYEYGDTVYWTKPNHFGFGKKSIGVRRATEMLLIGTRGRVTTNFRSQPDWFPAPVGEHSEKPFEQYAIISRIAGRTARTIELFARRRFPDARFGFWGNELEQCDVSLAPWGYPVPADNNAPIATASVVAAGGLGDE